MIQIKPLASGSGGNCYKIDDGKSSLLIEAGLPIKKIKQGLNYKLSEIEGCLISHEHL
jgi:phosphoribosyl 1,2-cyclic phosphodiesterase